jgi:hypothetical protein
MEIKAIAEDNRRHEVAVAGPAALMVAKLHKLGERLETPTRLNDKDAHDTYRILRAIPTANLVTTFRHLLADPISGKVTREALYYLRIMFGTPNATGSVMAGRAEEGVGYPEQVAVASSILANDLLASVT